MIRKHRAGWAVFISSIMIISLLLDPMPPARTLAATGTIDISNTSSNGKTFGKATNDERMRYQTFTATNLNKITSVDLRVKRDNGVPSNLTASLYATSANMPTGTALATASIAGSAVSTSFSTVSVPLTYSGLVNETKYAIVVSQATLSDSVYYEWACAATNSSCEFGRYNGTSWIDESSAGDGSVIINVTDGVSGTPTPVPTATPTPSTGVIDISNTSTSGKTFGKATNDERRRYETFTATSMNKITSIEVRVKSDNGVPSNLTASLYTTSANKPTGSALATASIAGSSVSSSFSSVTIPLTYTGLVNGTKYAIVLTQATLSDTTFYEWAYAVTNSNCEFGRYDGTNYIDESSVGDGSIKIYVSGVEATPTPTAVPTPTPTATPTPPVGVTPTPAPPGDVAKNYGFENGSTQGWAMDWGNGFGNPAVEWSGALAGGDGTETGTLKVNLNLNASGWQEANVAVWLAGSENSYYDFATVDYVEYDVYVPASYPGVIKVATALNATFQNIGPGFIDYNIPSMSKISINGTQYVKIHRSDYVGDINRNASGKLLIRIVGTSAVYSGGVYVDNVFLRHPSVPVFVPSTPVKYTKVSGNYNVTTGLFVPSTYSVSSVKLISGSSTNVNLTYNSSTSKYEGIWNTTTEAEGFQTVTLQITTTTGAVFTKSFEVLVQNNATVVNITTPTFDSTQSGTITVKATVSPSGETISSMTLYCDTTSVVMTLSGGVYSGSINTTAFKDGVYTLLVKAQGSKYLTKKYVEVNFKNKDYMNYFVTKTGTGSSTGFSVNGNTFKYTGWNCYDAVYKGTYTMPSAEKTVVYTSNGEELDSLLPASTLTYEQQIDRMMMEGKKTGSSVVRVWGFHTDPSSYDSFYNTDWTYKESQFAKFDYIMDSARRHGVRVMITLQNYWDDYGGIKAITNRFGLGCKLEYFTNANAKQQFKDYFNYFANRTNTVNGIKYKDDKTIFAWELMNEPRMDYYDDNTQGKTLYSPDGVTLGNWMNEMSTYMKSIDSNHMISTGSEGHGDGWCRSDEGYGDNPIGVQAQPNIDIVSCHPYPNEVWADYTMAKMDGYINKLITSANGANKAIIMGEYNLNKTQPLRDNNNVSVAITDPAYYSLRQQWFKDLMSNFRTNGGDGATLWVLQNTVAFDGYGVFTYSPGPNVIYDRPFAQILFDEWKLYNPNGIY